MSRRRPRPGRHEHHPSAQAMLREDYPARVKTALLLSVRGGRVPQGCLVCGRRGAWSRKVFIPDVALQPLPELDMTARPEAYVLCPNCEAEQPDVQEIARRLRRHKAGR